LNKTLVHRLYRHFKGFNVLGELVRVINSIKNIRFLKILEVKCSLKRNGQRNETANIPYIVITIANISPKWGKSKYSDITRIPKGEKGATNAL